MKRSHLKLEFDHLTQHKALFAAALLSRGIWELVPMQVPLLAGAIIDGVSGKGLRLFGFSWPDASPECVLKIAALGLVAVAVVYSLSAYASAITGAMLDKKFVANLRKAVIGKIMLLSLDQHQRQGQGELLDCALRHTDRLRGFTERVFTRALTNTVRAGYPVFMLFFINPMLALIALSIVPPQWFATWCLQRRLHAATRRSMASHSRLTAALHENLDGFETIKAMNAEAVSIERLHDSADRVEVDELATERITAVIRASTWFITSVGIALIWWQGGLRVLSGEMTLGMLVAFAGFAEFAYRPFRLFTNIVKTYRVGVASLEHIQELLESEPTIRNDGAGIPLTIDRGRIEFRDVAFSYRDREVLSDINLVMEAGQFTAIVGPNGSGKSSLLRLIARLYDPDSGQLKIDGQSLASAPHESIRSQIAVVPQRAVLFAGSVFENIRLAKPDATDKEVRVACESASALEFIERLEKGFDTQLGRHGASLSVGEAQRIGIARALLSHPRILLLDEPTAALDAASELAVVRSLLKLRGAMTVILVGHRPQAVRWADRVVVMDSGRVVAEGTHEQLQGQSPFYRELFGTGAIHGSNR